MINVLNFNQNL